MQKGIRTLRECEIRLSRFNESMKGLQFQDLFVDWFEGELHKCDPRDPATSDLMSRFSKVIGYSLRFVPSGTTIVSKPLSTQSADLLHWIESLTALSKLIEANIKTYFENHPTKTLRNMKQPKKRRLNAESPPLFVSSLYKAFGEIKDLSTLPKPLNFRDFANQSLRWKYKVVNIPTTVYTTTAQQKSSTM